MIMKMLVKMSIVKAKIVISKGMNKVICYSVN